VERMLAIMRTIFVEFQLLLNIAPVFAGCVIAPFALAALKGYQFHRCLFARHIKPLYILGKWKFP
jgi:hypothetical protein